jgi:hypothetical protein
VAAAATVNRTKARFIGDSGLEEDECELHSIPEFFNAVPV